MQPSLVSIIIPARNEEKHIARCLDSIVFSDYPKDKLEILVIDGMSEDGTRKVIDDYSKKYPYIKLLDNQNKFTPFGLNIGIKNAKGGIIIRMDAHAVYPKDYISKCLKYLEKYNADNVGGVIKTLPKGNKLISRAIALSLSHPFGAGSSHFRIGADKPKWVDTVFGGCWGKEIFDKIGFFNEKLIRSQDIEFNLRLKRAGGKILLIPDIVSYYYPKSNLKDFFIHNIKDGIWAIYPLKFIRFPLRLRHYIPLLFVLSLLGTGLLGIFLGIFFRLFIFIICLYLLVGIYFSLKTAIKKREIGFLFVMPLVFAARHIGYGLGSVFGLVKLFKK